MTEANERAAADLAAIRTAVQRVIVGQDRMIDRMLLALLTGGHCLLEGVPGVAKTLAVQTLATVVDGTFSRLQFTPDLVPSDVVGTRIYRPSSETFDVELGPVFANIVLADEINRAPAKVQSAMLEVMAEQQVSIGGRSFAVPQPFLVLATQNPIESEGVYQLPEAQRDRFLFKISVGYPSQAEEVEIVLRMGAHPVAATPAVGLERLVRLRELVADVYTHHSVVDYAVRIVAATRAPQLAGMPDLAGMLAYGAGPRGSLGLVAAARALAVLRGRHHITPADIRDVGEDVLTHRLVLSFDALADGVDSADIVRRVLATVPQPDAGQPPPPPRPAPVTLEPEPGPPVTASGLGPWAVPSGPFRAAGRG